MDMKDNDRSMKPQGDLLVESFFERYAKKDIADDGFSQRVISQLPRRETSRIEKLDHLLTAICAAAAVVLFLCFGGADNVFAIARNAWYNLLSVVFSAEMPFSSVLTAVLAVYALLSVSVYNIAVADERSPFSAMRISLRHLF